MGSKLCAVGLHSLSWNAGVYICDIDKEIYCNLHALSHNSDHILNELKWELANTRSRPRVLHCNNCSTSKQLIINVIFRQCINSAKSNTECSGPHFVGYTCDEHDYDLCGKCMEERRDCELLRIHRLRSHKNTAVRWKLFTPDPGNDDRPPLGLFGWFTPSKKADTRDIRTWGTQFGVPNVVGGRGGGSGFSSSPVYRPETQFDRSIPTNNPVTILVISADPTDTSRLRINTERREVGQALKSTKHGEKYTWRDAPSCRIRDITSALDEHKPKILLFTGHGDCQGICFEDDYGRAAIVPTVKLADLLRDQEDLDLVIMNACYSASQAQAIADAVGHVVGMENVASDQDAISFSREFFTALGDGRTFEASFIRAKKAIALDSNCTIVPHFLVRQ